MLISILTPPFVEWAEWRVAKWAGLSLTKTMSVMSNDSLWDIRRQLWEVPSTAAFWLWGAFHFLHSSTIVSVADLTHPNLPVHNKPIFAKK